MDFFVLSLSIMDRPIANRSSNPVPARKRKQPDEPPEPSPVTDKKPRHNHGGISGQMKSEGPLDVSLPGMVVLNSKPGGGKSHLARYLFYLNRHRFAHGIVFSKSAFRPGNLDYIPNFGGTPEDVRQYYNFKHMRYNRDVLKAFLEGQARYPEGQRPLGFIYVDDDVSEKNMFEDEYIIDAATMYRQYNVLFIIATQYVNKVSTTVRECASQVGLFKMDSKRSLEAAYESYGQEFEDFNDFRDWLNKATTPGTLHNFCWKNKMEDKPWEILRAPANIPKFRLDYGRKPDADKGKKTRKRKRTRSKKEKSIMQKDFDALGRLVGMHAKAMDPTSEAKAFHPRKKARY
jgi:hypothetical protein